jgi:hypothetical protein
MVVAGLWILSVIGSWANFLTPNGGVLGDLRMGGGRRMDVGMDGRGRGPERAHTEWAWQNGGVGGYGSERSVMRLQNGRGRGRGHGRGRGVPAGVSFLA